MKEQQRKLIKMLRLWLKKNSLDSDTTLYKIEDWQKRNEEYHNDSEFVITIEGGLYFTLNYGDSEEFYDLVESFGYYCELGHAWNLGFYVEEIDGSRKKYRSYSEKLKDYRWQQKRKHILERANYECEDCHSYKALEIHHCYYLYGNEPWEYPFDSLRCLCKKCHIERDSVEKVLRGHLATLKTSELKSLISQISEGSLSNQS